MDELDRKLARPSSRPGSRSPQKQGGGSSGSSATAYNLQLPAQRGPEPWRGLVVSDGVDSADSVDDDGSVIDTQAAKPDTLVRVEGQHAAPPGGGSSGSQ